MLYRSGGDARPNLSGGDWLSHCTKAHAGVLQAALNEAAGVILAELKALRAPKSKIDLTS